MARCHRCGGEVEEGDRYCKHCGAKLSGRRPSATMEALAAEYRAVVEEHPEDVDARYSLALALLYNEHFAEAAEHLRKVIELTPEFPDAYARLVVCLARLGQYQEAVVIVERGLEVAPDHRDLLSLRQQLRELGY